MASSSLPDIQSLKDSRGITLNRVGITAFTKPVSIIIEGKKVSTIGTFNFFHALGQEHKGTHMSRFVEIIHDFFDKPFSIADIKDVLEESQKKFKVQDIFFEISMPIFWEKSISKSNADRKTLGESDLKIFAEIHEQDYDLRIEVQTEGTSCCPCSKEISDYGAHNQRVTFVSLLSLRENESDFPLFRYLRDIDTVFSSPLYPLLKRVDEKKISEMMYENAKFVEDIVRDGLILIKKDYTSYAYAASVSVESHESIHQHNAYAESEIEL